MSELISAGLGALEAAKERGLDMSDMSSSRARAEHLKEKVAQLHHDSSTTQRQSASVPTLTELLEAAATHPESQ